MLLLVYIFALAVCIQFAAVDGLAVIQIESFARDISTGYKRRVAADPSFPSKSVAEVMVAAGTQFAAEWNRRGSNRVIPEIDFVIAGMLTAIFGKYYSMWKTAQTQIGNDEGLASSIKNEAIVVGMKVPTNAFQKYMLDGLTKPSLKLRMLSFIAPIVSLFRAGFISSMVGYGIVAIMIQFRSLLIPNYIPVTKSVNILYASLYTGAFMAIVSNIRYQILQGIVEPAIASFTQKNPVLKGMLFLFFRVANGILGSILAISGMKWLGLQRLK